MDSRQDRYGLSWQVMFRGAGEITQKITPMLMFVGERSGKAEEAIRLNTSVFGNTETGAILRWGKGEEPEKKRNNKACRLHAGRPGVRGHG